MLSVSVVYLLGEIMAGTLRIRHITSDYEVYDPNTGIVYYAAKTLPEAEGYKKRHEHRNNGTNK